MSETIFTKSELREISKTTRPVKPLKVKDPINNKYDKIVIVRKRTEKIFKDMAI